MQMPIKKPVVAINTLVFAKQLREAGLNARQAELQSEATNEVLIEFQDRHLSDLVTKECLKAEIAEVKAEFAEVKADISRVENELKADISRVESGLKADISRVENGLKADISRVENGLEADISRVENGLKAQIADIKTDISRAESKLIKWGMGIFIALVSAMAGLIKFL
jgi:hypothetical protein